MKPVISQNHFLAALPRALQETFDEHIEIIEVFKGSLPRSKSRSEDYLDFPLTALYSVDIRMSDGFNAHIALLGYRNVIATTSSATPPLPSAARVLTPGYVLRMPASIFHDECARSPELQRALQNQMFNLAQLMGFVTACNLHHQLQKRLSRWLLSAVTASAAKHFDLTHEELAGLLGVRREAVTESLAKLALAGAIAMSRGRVSISDPALLEQSACECHGFAKLYENMSSFRSGPGDRHIAIVG